VLYVALTRARNALYVVVPRLPARPEALREADLLRARLAGDGEPQDSLCGLPVLYAAGDRAWCSPAAARAGAALETPDIASRPEPLAVAFSAPPARREPSKEQTEGKPFPARWFFGREAGDVRAFGSALHRLFERIEWIEDADVEAVLAAWRAESVEAAAVRRDVETQFRRCLASAEVRALLARPAGAARCEVWRETPFDFVREGAIGREIVAGRFDRVVIERDAAGRPLRATVVDFKSNRVADETEMDAAAEGYRGQMRDYAAAAARLLGLPAGAVRAKLLYTRLARAREAGHWRLGGDGGEAPREAGA
jgi:ATP-dependent helicase/nuclease subunit A